MVVGIFAIDQKQVNQNFAVVVHIVAFEAAGTFVINRSQANLVPHTITD